MRLETIPTPQRSMVWHQILATLAALGLMLSVSAAPARAAAPAATNDVEFNADFLQSSGVNKADIGRFSKDNVVPAGDYPVDLTLNGEWRERITIHFAVPPGAVNAKPCLTVPVLTQIGLNFAALAPGTRAAWGPDKCIDGLRIAETAKVSFDLATLTLSLSLPQALLVRRPHGYVSPQSWDKGVPSITLAYDASVFRSTVQGVTTTSAFAGLTAGANLGDWHIRDRSSLSGANGHWTFQNIAAYVQRDLPGLQSNLMVGDTYTDGAVFDSFGFRGVSLGTDDRMRPDSISGYAPIVRGIAHTNARVRITQHGTVLMEVTVAPGAFEIDDLYPTGYGGDLLVTVLESDGSQESFTVTYASLVQLLRPHVWRYSIAAGDLQVNGFRTGERFAQATVQHGMTDAVTTYAGAQSAPGYGAGLVGLALNTKLGGLSLDATLARTRLTPMQVDQGYSVRLSYSKIVPGIGTNLSLAAYRYSSSGFWSLQDAMGNRVTYSLPSGTTAIERQHSRVQVNITQTLPRKWGNLYFTGSSTKYWDNGGSVTQFQGGYSNVSVLHKMVVNYGITVSQQRDDVTTQTDRRMLFTMTMALGQKSNAPRLSANLGTDRTGGQSQASGGVALNGTLGQDGEYT